MNDSLRALYERVEPVAVNPLREEFLALVDAHGEAVMATLTRLCRNSHDADDVFQETAIRVWRNFATRPRLLNPRAWLIKIAYRAFLDHHSRQRPHDLLVEMCDYREPAPSARSEHVDQLNHLMATVDSLPAILRDVVVLHYTGGLTLRQTADVLGISSGTVKSRLNAGLAKLRSVLQ